MVGRRSPLLVVAAAAATSAACLPPSTVVNILARPPYLEWTGRSWTNIQTGWLIKLWALRAAGGNERGWWAPAPPPLLVVDAAGVRQFAAVILDKVAVNIAITFVSVILAILVVSSQHESNCDHLQMGVLTESADKTKSGPFYQPPKTNPFKLLAIAEQPVTDKVTTHTYKFMYDKYLGMRRMQRLKLLEIGLGCAMNYGPGASATVWRKYLPRAELWFAEFDDCVALNKPRLDALSVKVVTGDQADVETLEGWVKETQGGFDVIVDDGGHQNRQILASFIVLFQKALRPGGVYFLEDMHVSRIGGYRGALSSLMCCVTGRRAC